MKTFILVTFGLLGFTFYELSGGDEFDANALRVSRVDAAPLALQESTETQIAAVQAPKPETISASNEVSRSVVTLASLTTQSSEDRVSVTLAPAAVTAPVVEEEEKVSALILPSLIASNDQPLVEAEKLDPQVVETLAIFRTVSGNRVNVRGGPGTNYDVVSRLVKGQEVEILSDPGNGWVKMRPADGGSVGWLADFLLNES